MHAMECDAEPGQILNKAWGRFPVDSCRFPAQNAGFCWRSRGSDTLPRAWEIHQKYGNWASGALRFHPGPRCDIWASLMMLFGCASIRRGRHAMSRLSARRPWRGHRNADSGSRGARSSHPRARATVTVRLGKGLPPLTLGRAGTLLGRRAPKLPDTAPVRRGGEGYDVIWMRFDPLRISWKTKRFARGARRKTGPPCATQPFPGRKRKVARGAPHPLLTLGLPSAYPRVSGG